MGSSAVGRYWQGCCTGFVVCSPRGRRLGRVEAVELDRETRAVVLLLVRRRRRKPLRVRPDSVEVVDPWRQLLVVARPPRPTIEATALARPVVRGGRLAAAGTRTGVVRGGRVAAASAAAVGRGARRTAPRARNALAWAGPRALFGLGLVAWAYGLVVFTVVRIVVWLVAALTVGTARSGARLRPHFPRAKPSW